MAAIAVKSTAEGADCYPGFRYISLQEMFGRLKGYFPDFRPVYFPELDHAGVRAGYEHRVVIPHYSVVAKTEVEAIARVVGLLQKERQFENYLPLFGNPSPIVDHQNSSIAPVERFEEERRAVWSVGRGHAVLDMQFGGRTAGATIAGVDERFGVGEFPLGLYELLILLLLNPTRLSNLDQLKIVIGAEQYLVDGEPRALVLDACCSKDEGTKKEKFRAPRLDFYWAHLPLHGSGIPTAVFSA